MPEEPPRWHRTAARTRPATATTEAELPDFRFDIPPLRPVAHDHQSDIPGQAVHRLDQIAMALPAPQGRHDTDETALRRKPGRAPRRVARTRNEACRVNPRRDRGDALGWNAVVADQLHAQVFSRGHDVPRGIAIQPSRGQVVRDRSGNVPRAHQRRGTGQGRTGERGEPAVGRTVTVDDIDGVSLQPSAHRENSAQILPCDPQSLCVQTSLERGFVDPCLARRGNRDAVPARRHPLRLVENPDLLPAPSA